MFDFPVDNHSRPAVDALAPPMVAPTAAGKPMMAFAEGLAQRNVAALVRPPRAAREVTALRVQEARLLLQTARSGRVYASGSSR